MDIVIPSPGPIKDTYFFPYADPNKRISPELTETRLDKDCYGKALTPEEVFNVKPLFDGYKKGELGDFETCNYSKRKIRGVIDKKPMGAPDEAGKFSSTESYNKIIKKAQYGFQSPIPQEIIDSMGAEKYLLMDDGRGMEQVNRLNFGYKDANYAGFQQWNREEPTERLNMAVDYKTVSY